MEKVKDFILKHKKILVILTSILCFLLIGFMIYNYLLLPKIELNGNKKIIVDYKEDYVDKGYSASYLGEDISDDVKVSGVVNPNKLGEYVVTYKVTKNGFTRTVKRKISVKDRVSPVINISDSKEVILCPGSKFKEEEYTASDNHDGDLTSKVKIEVIDDEAIYSVTDDSGNTTSVKKKVIYKDVEAPILTLNGNDVVYAFIGEDYIEKGFSAADNCSGDLSSKVEVSGSVNTAIGGNYEISYNVTDDGGNTTTKTRKVIVTERGKNGVIYLTFDDGPQSGTTNVILDILKEENVKATFFVTNKGPDDLIKRIYDEGHTVALHTATHDYATVYASVDAYFNDLYSVQSRVKRITGYTSMIIRFPGGASNTVSRKYSPGIMTTLTREVLNRGFKYYDWNVSSGDAGGAKNSADVYNNVIYGIKPNRVNMVLLHDIKGITRDAIRNIIRYGKDNGYSFEKITMDTEMITQRVNN